MSNQAKMELIKKLETLAAFQKDCLDKGFWEDYDKAGNEMEKLEEKIVYEK